MTDNEWMGAQEGEAAYYERREETRTKRSPDQRISRHLFALERRREWLTGKDGKGPRNSYEQAELAALTWAIQQLREDNWR